MSLPALFLAAAVVGQLSLAEAIGRAGSQNYDVTADRARLSASQADRDATAGKALPQLSLRNNLNYTQLPGGQSQAALSGLGGLVGFPQSGGTLDTTISGSVTLFDGFANRDNLAVAEHQIAVAKLTWEQARQDAMRDAAVAYFDVLGAQAQVATATNAVKQSEAHLKTGEARLAAGTATRAETLKLRAELSASKRTLVQGRYAVEKARLALAQAMNGAVGDRPLDPDPPVRPLALKAERDLPAGIDRRSDVRQAALRARQDALRAEIDDRAGWPALSGNSSYTQRGFGAGQFVAGVGLNWPFFDGQQNRRRADSSHFQAEAARADAARARQTAEVELRRQLATRDEAREVLEASREGLASAAEAYRLARLRYDEGVATTIEVVDGQATLLDARRSYETGVRDLRVAEIQLARSLGVDLASYLGATR